MGIVVRVVAADTDEAVLVQQPVHSDARLMSPLVLDQLLSMPTSRVPKGRALRIATSLRSVSRDQRSTVMRTRGARTT